MTRCPVSHKFCSWGPCSEELQQGSCLFTFVVKSQLFVYFGFKTVDLLLNLSSLKALSRLYTYTRISKPRLWVSCLFTFAVEISAVCLQSQIENRWKGSMNVKYSTFALKASKGVELFFYIIEFYNWSKNPTVLKIQITQEFFGTISKKNIPWSPPVSFRNR